MAIDFNKALNDVKGNINVGNLGNDPWETQRIASGMTKLSMYSKAWEVGDQAIVFYPVRWRSNPNRPSGEFALHVSAYLGHKVSDYKLMGTTFLRSLSPVDINGNVLGNGDLAYQFSRIAPLLVNAQKERELAELDSRDWSILGQSAYMDARKTIEEAYDTKVNINAKRPLLGRLGVVRMTEVVFVATDGTGAPIFEDMRKRKTGRYIQELSNSRIEKLTSLANDPNYGVIAQNPDLELNEHDIYFLEVQYSYTSAKNSRSEAGRADPQGVSHDVTMRHRYPDKVGLLEPMQKEIPKTADGIASHTYSMSPMPDEVLIQKLQHVMSASAGALTYLSPIDKDKLVKNAELIDYLRVAPQGDPELNARLEEVLGHPVGRGATVAATPNSIPVDNNGIPDFKAHAAVQETASPTLDSLMGDLGGAPANRVVPSAEYEKVPSLENTTPTFEDLTGNLDTFSDLNV